MNLLRVNGTRLQNLLSELNSIGRLPSGGVKRLALSNEDKEAREWLLNQFERLGMDVRIDQVGNMFGIRKGRGDHEYVATGSHLDTVPTGGDFDGSLGVIAGLEIVEVLNDHGIETEKNLVVANFTNEEGVRFTPDMMGSLVYSGQARVDDILKTPAVGDQPSSPTTLGDELKSAGFAGSMKPGSIPFDAFVELHIEQGPVLESGKLDVAAVDLVQGIYWTEYELHGRSSHAGTTPVDLRKDAGLVAAEAIGFARRMSLQYKKELLTTCGSIEFSPNVVNVVPEKVRFTLDMRHPDAVSLKKAQQEFDAMLQSLAADQDVTIKRKPLVRFDPVSFDLNMVFSIGKAAADLGLSCKTMHSGAGHDAQMMAAVCPAAMIFIPSKDGISHNIKEYSAPRDVENGANELLNVLTGLLGIQG